MERLGFIRTSRGERFLQYASAAGALCHRANLIAEAHYSPNHIGQWSHLFKFDCRADRFTNLGDCKAMPHSHELEAETSSTCTHNPIRVMAAP